MSYSRRKYLAAITVGATSLSGCAGSGDDETTRSTKTTAKAEVIGTPETIETTERTDQQSSHDIPEIRISNKHPEPRWFHVLVLEGESPAFWRSYRADAAEFEDGRIARVTGTVWEDPLPESGDFAVYVRIDDQTEWKSWYRTTISGRVPTWSSRSKPTDIFR